MNLMRYIAFVTGEHNSYCVSKLQITKLNLDHFAQNIKRIPLNCINL